MPPPASVAPVAAAADWLFRSHKTSKTMLYDSSNDTTQDSWVNAIDYTMEDLALDIEVLESCRELYLSSVKDSVGNLWVDTDSEGYLDCSDEFKELLQDILQGLKSHLIRPDGAGNMANRVKFVQMGYRLVHIRQEGTQHQHVLKLYHPGSKNHILLNYA